MPQVPTTLVCLCAVTPPGYKTTNGTTVPCGDGEYRPDWRPATAASRCLECGEHIMSYPLDQIVQYAITVDANATQVAVRASAASCCECLCSVQHSVVVWFSPLSACNLILAYCRAGGSLFCSCEYPGTSMP